ncbi:C40 family peptidase [Pseudoflavonifractor capillosus]|nr:NlpC/P60 family protein [Pseudoflavonifractor capillosus]
MGSTAKTAVKERGVPVKSAGHPIRKTAGIGKPGGKPPVRAFPARQARRAAEAGARLAQTQKAAKAARVTARQAAQAANRALRAVIAAAKALAAAATAGGGVVIAVVVVICLCGIILASPLGIFFAGPDETTGAISPAQAVAQINGELGEKISSMQAEGGYDTLEIQGQPPPWSDILAVFAAKTAGAADGTTVAILDAANVEALRTVFWDMTKLASSSRAVEHPASGDTPAWTEQILTVTITARTPDDMRVFYSFTEEQNKALDELLENSDMLAALAGDLTISDATAKKLLAELPTDLNPERRAVVETACRLVGKVNYFWGGKSLVIGWDSRWGQLTKVWADGSSTTGTYLPYGLDCSGFVDWVFYNVTDGEYVIGHGGGAHMQHTYCTPISWNEAQPGDLVFYPGDEHVGIVGGRDTNGRLLIIHCAFSQNNVVITESEGFVAAAKPSFY